MEDHSGWFDVSRSGLKQLMDGRPKSFLVRELVQNAWDEDGVTDVDVTLEHYGRNTAQLLVKDNAPEGFYELCHAYTLFAETRKRKDPNKRGRFNLGEKQVLALCIDARISTTTGTVLFKTDGKRERTKERTRVGSFFQATIRMTKPEIEECIAALRSFLPPKGITTRINREVVEHRDPVATRKAKLTTEYTDHEGHWRRSKRNTTIEIHEVKDGEVPTLYEMGIPVVELEGGDKYHLNVNQRVPLNQDRDNVSPAYLRDLRGEVINEVARFLSKEEATESWVREAVETERVEKEAFEEVLTKRFGNKVATYSVNDPESNHAAVASGYTVLHGGSMSKGEWANVKRFESVRPSHSVAPTSFARFSPNGKDTTIPEEKWTPEMTQVVRYIEMLGRELIGGVVVRIAKSKQNFAGCYGDREITLNYNRLGKAWFDLELNRSQVTGLAIHELAHEKVSNHLDMAYINEVSRLAGEAVELALNSPKLFKVRK